MRLRFTAGAKLIFREGWGKAVGGPSVLIPKYLHEMELWSLKNWVALLRIFPMPRFSFPTSALFVGRECSFTPSSRLEFEIRILVDFA
jgi:hypothetical protein